MCFGSKLISLKSRVSRDDNFYIVLKCPTRNSVSSLPIYKNTLIKIIFIDVLEAVGQ